MASPIAQLHSLGWLWRENGVELCVNLDGRELRVFVPLRHVIATFHGELAREGFTPAPRVGGHSVAGFFDDIASAAKSIGRGATRAVARASSSVVRTAAKWGSKAGQAAIDVGRNKYFRGALAAASLAMPVLAPAAAGLELANRAYDAGHAAHQFIRNPSFSRLTNVAMNAVPGPYGEIARRAIPMASQGVQFARNPTFGGAMALAQHAPGPFGGYAQQARRYAGMAQQAHQFARPIMQGRQLAPMLTRQAAPAFARAVRRQNIFGRAMGGGFGMR
jgi:hypothetical protein